MSKWATGFLAAQPGFKFFKDPAPWLPTRPPTRPPAQGSAHGGGLVGRPSNLSLSWRSALVRVDLVIPSSLMFSSGCFCI